MDSPCRNKYDCGNYFTSCRDFAQIRSLVPVGIQTNTHINHLLTKGSKMVFASRVKSVVIVFPSVTFSEARCVK